MNKNEKEPKSPVSEAIKGGLNSLKKESPKESQVKDKDSLDLLGIVKKLSDRKFGKKK